MLRRNLNTEESREYWADVDKAAARVESWPDWKKTVLPCISKKKDKRQEKGNKMGIEKSCPGCKGSGIVGMGGDKTQPWLIWETRFSEQGLSEAISNGLLEKKECIECEGKGKLETHSMSFYGLSRGHVIVEVDDEVTHEYPHRSCVIGLTTPTKGMRIHCFMDYLDTWVFAPGIHAKGEKFPEEWVVGIWGSYSDSTELALRIPSNYTIERLDK